MRKYASSSPDCGSRLRILIVTTVPETFATILRGQPKYLQKQFSVDLACSADAYGSMVESNECITPKYVPMSRGMSPARDIWSCVRMIGVILRAKPHLIHSYTPKGGLVAMLSGFLCRVPIRVHTFTGLIFPTSTGFRRWLLKSVDRLICSCATHVIPEGEGVRRDLLGHKVSNKVLPVIGWGNIAGVDTAYFDPKNPEVHQAASDLRRRVSIPTGNQVFCFVGRINRDKGIHELVEAFSHLPDDVHLLLVGARDNSNPVSAGCAEKIRRHPRIHEIGFLPDIRPALLTSHALILPSYREGFPNVLLQAGSMQLPVIATNVNGSNEIIQDGVNGWLVEAHDVKALSEAMSRAISQPIEERSKMARAARQRVAQRFEQREHWQRMLAFYVGSTSSLRQPNQEKKARA